MATQLTAEDARQSMQSHVALKGTEIAEAYGPRIGWKQLLAVLNDRRFVRYPCDVVFAESGLLEGEIAHAEAKGERPEEGFTIFVHPYFALQMDKVPHLVLYQLVLVNYGEFASIDDAEIFGAAALGIGREKYYAILCSLADELNEALWGTASGCSQR